MSEEMILLAVFLTTSVVFAGLSIPLMLKLVAPNPWYGWRTRSTLGNPDIWYPVNQVTGAWLFVTGAVMAATAIWTHLADFDADRGAWITLGTSAVGLLALVVHGSLVIHRKNR